MTRSGVKNAQRDLADLLQLSRLIAGSGASPTKQKPNTPAERLAICKKACNALQVLIEELVL